MDHGLENTPEERLFTELNDLKQKYEELRTLQLQSIAALQPAVSGTYRAVSPSIPAGGEVTFIYTYSPTDSQSLVTSFHFTLYQDSELLANSINLYYPGSYEWKWWRDWSLTDNVNVKDFVYVKNNTGAAHVIRMAANWRYFVTGGAGSS